jgi:hypothetical protein
MASGGEKSAYLQEKEEARNDALEESHKRERAWWEVDKEALDAAATAPLRAIDADAVGGGVGVGLRYSMHRVAEWGDELMAMESHAQADSFRFLSMA